jgi:outer membrane protein OmpA-like peptidoglycan-associated protein/tetratricopeptide (TPR) repeat protein
MIRVVLVGLIALLFIQPLHAQEQPGKRAQADRLFERYEYFKSLNLYLDLANADNPALIVVERVADCYRLMNNYNQAEQWYARVVTYPGSRPIDHYYYAEALLRNKKFDKAKEQYQLYFTQNGSKENLDFKLAACDSAAAWMKLPGSYQVNIEKKMNSTDADWGVSYLNDSNLIFTSDRATTDHSGKISNRTGTEWLKLFNYDINNSNITELPLDNSGSIDLTKDYHTGPMAINATGDTAYITVTTQQSRGKLPNDRTASDEHLYTRRLELIMATKKNGKWGNFTRFPYNNVSAYSVGHAALSRNGEVMYFTSDMPGGYGKTDIWYCVKIAGKWTSPVNCGRTINTLDNEAFPSVGADDKLYYSSRGLPGMGGYDIFSAKGSGTNWSTPVNLKYPLNSTSDDFAFVSKDGVTGYISSDRDGGQGNDDIYSFIYLGNETPEKLVSSPAIVAAPNSVRAAGRGVDPFGNPPPVAEPVTTEPAPYIPAAPVVVAAPVKHTPAVKAPVATPAPAVVSTPDIITLSGFIFDGSTHQPLDSVSVILKDAKGATINTDLALIDRKFSFRVTGGRDYIIELQKKGYYAVTQRIKAKDIPKLSMTAIALTMEPLALGKTFILRNIYYDLNRASIRKDAMVELDNLVSIMKNNPSLRIELSSHTDSRGSDYYNMLLSEARAISAVAYIKRRGIAADRMEAKGYGETRLLNKCGNGVQCSEEDHQFNRRTEIKVIGGTFDAK